MSSFEGWWEKNFPGRSYVNRYACAKRAWRDGKEEVRGEAAAEARRFGEETLARNIGLLPLEEDDDA